MEWWILTFLSQWWFRHFKDPKNTCLPVVGHGTTFLTYFKLQILQNASNRDFIAILTFSNHLNRLRSFKMLQSLVSSLTRSNTCNKHAGCKRKAIWSKQSAVTLQFFFFEGDPIQPTSNPVATGSCHGCCYYQAGAPPRRTKEFVLANSGCLFLRDLTTCPWRICCHSFESNNIQGGS